MLSKGMHPVVALANSYLHVEASFMSSKAMDDSGTTVSTRLLRQNLTLLHTSRRQAVMTIVDFNAAKVHIACLNGMLTWFCIGVHC